MELEAVLLTKPWGYISIPYLSKQVDKQKNKLKEQERNDVICPVFVTCVLK